MYYNSKKPNTCPMGTTSYMIKAGDTFYSIAIRYNTTVAALIAANPNVNPNALCIGQIICIPIPFPPCPGGNYYTIRAGDTFFSIARRFNVSLDALLNANPNVNPDALYIGQVICIPGPTPPPPVTCPAGTMPYIIRAGDTFFSIARRFNVSLDALIAANPNVDPDNLMIGQRICIPGPTPPGCPAGTTPYTIRSGDTFFLLAQRFNTTVEAIQRANPGVDPNNLQIGQVICMPGIPPTPGCPAGTTPYTIRSGDTFFLLAQRFNTTVEAIQRANPGVDPNNLQIGQVICMPGTPPTPGCPAGTTPYTIRSGDTFFLLAQRFNTTVEAIQRANPGVNPNNLQIGQVICMPGDTTPPPSGCPTGTTSYTIRSGDTFFLLAQRFNTTVEAIQRANPGVNPNNLQIGQRICIPTAN
ncbi:LysM peptidoglycan-binding domain-containing protein [Alkaliphilus flagellatus]|nr:LysM peptidoglycan-binding domain-containing protein [Alkaliphilus flagellatus]